MPHCTLPFKGTRYTLIYFINQSYQIMQPACLKFCKELGGFTNWPKPGLVKKPYKPVVERLVDGKAAYRAWLLTPAGKGCTYQLPDTDDEEDDDEEEGGASGGGKAKKKKQKKKKASTKKKETKQQPKKRMKVSTSGDEGSGSDEDPFAALEGDDEEQEYDIEKVLAVRAVGPTGRKKEYQVRWLGYGEEADTWEPEKHFIGDSKRLLDEFRAAQAASA